MPDFAEMSDEQVHQAWQSTKMVFSSVLPGVELPIYTSEMATRHAAAEAELIGRGYVEEIPNWWVGPDRRTF